MQGKFDAGFWKSVKFADVASLPYNASMIHAATIEKNPKTEPVKEPEDHTRSLLKMLLLLALPVSCFVLTLTLAIYQTGVTPCQYNHLYQDWAYAGIALSSFWAIYITALWPDFNIRKFDSERERTRQIVTGIAHIGAIVAAIATLDVLVQGIFLIRLPYRLCSDQFFPNSVRYIETFYSAILGAAILAALVLIKITIFNFLPRETEEDVRRK